MAVVPVLVLLATGCGGFQASRGISPATFLLPGLLKADPAPAPHTEELPVVSSDTQVASL